MKGPVAVIIAPAIILASSFKTLTPAFVAAGNLRTATLAGNDLPGDPYDPPPYGRNPHGGNPHGGDPHDENHDPSMPSNDQELKRKNPDPNGNN